MTTTASSGAIWRRIPTFLIYIGAGFAIVVAFSISYHRICFPYEIVWMEGSVMDQIHRMVSGGLLYEAPSIQYVSWPYQPLYYYISAAVTSLTGVSFLAGRLVSVCSTIGTAIILFYAVRRDTTRTVYAIAAVALFIGAENKTGLFFDVVRVDALSVMLLTGAAVALANAQTSRQIFIATILFTLSYFAKQAAIFFLPGFVLYLFISRGLKESLIFCTGIMIEIIVISYLMNVHYHGWHYYYTTIVPFARRSTLQWAFALKGFTEYILLRCWLPTTVMSLWILVRFLTKRSFDKKLLNGVFFFLSSLGAGFLGILNEGGAHNDYLPIAAAAAYLLPTALSEFEIIGIGRKMIEWVLPLQIVLLLSFPLSIRTVHITDEDRATNKTFISMLDSLKGEVWVPYHGFVPSLAGKRTYAELLALRDVLRVHDSVSETFSKALNDSLAAGHWSYIIDDLRDWFPHYHIERSIVNPNINHLAGQDSLYIYVADARTKTIRSSD